jgi:hypothetical protein
MTVPVTRERLDPRQRRFVAVRRHEFAGPDAVTRERVFDPRVEERPPMRRDGDGPERPRCGTAHGLVRVCVGDSEQGVEVSFLVELRQRAHGGAAGRRFRCAQQIHDCSVRARGADRGREYSESSASSFRVRRAMRLESGRSRRAHELVDVERDLRAVW